MRRLLALFVVGLLAVQAPAKTTRLPNPYPNELSRFKFYAKYLNPLRPYVSDHTLVVRVLGSDETMELSHWRITPYFVGEKNAVNGHAWAHDITSRLASLDIRPKQRVSMLGVKFPAAFTHSLGGVSEVNVSCDVYSDSFGLQYWLYEEDSIAARKGDLMEIKYGPSESTERQMIGPP